MAQTANNIVFAGPVRVFIAPYSYTSLEAAPASTVAHAGSWGGNWVEVGFTKGGYVFKPEVEASMVQMDQVLAPVEARYTKQSASLTFAAGEATLTNIKQALGAGTITTGSTESSFTGVSTGFIPTYYTVGVEQYAPGADSGDAWYRRIFLWKALMLPDMELKASVDEEQLVAYTCQGLYEAQASGVYKIIDRTVD